MNYRGKHKYMELAPCRVCRMSAGVRKVTTSVPERFFVVCQCCGYKTQPCSTQSLATKEWNYYEG